MSDWHCCVPTTMYYYVQNCYLLKFCLKMISIQSVYNYKYNKHTIMKPELTGTLDEFRNFLFLREEFIVLEVKLARHFFVYLQNAKLFSESYQKL